jgi:pimeloyl-ACP methyl ester carboxylesterase
MSMTTFLLVHGAFCGGWVWTDTAAALRAAGDDVHVVDLPSSGKAATGLGDLEADSAVVRQALVDLDEVVLVGHSGGGMSLAEQAEHPKVRHSVYLAALWPQKGQSVSELLGGQMPDWVVVRDDGTVQVSDDLEVARQALCADVEADRFAREVHPRYLLTSMSSLTAASSGPVRTHPATYVVCEQDHAVPVVAQEAMAASFDRVERLPSSHSPMLSMPGRLADVLHDVGSSA